MRLYRPVHLLALGFSIVGVACGSGSDSQPASSPPGTVIGQALLFDNLDHSNTRVVLSAELAQSDPSRPAPTITFSAVTNAAGVFEVTGLPMGTYVATFDHDTYAEAKRVNVIVSDTGVGRLDLGRVVLTRAALVANGQDVVPGSKSPAADRQLFVIDGQVNVYDQNAGTLATVPAPVVGGSFSTDGKVALLTSGTQASTSASDSLYVARLDVAPGQPIAPPVLVSSNAVGAGMSPDATRAFVLTPNGNGSNADLWTLALSDPSKLTQAGTNLPMSAITAIPDPTFPQTGAYVVPVYKQLAYDDNPQTVGGVSVHDFNLFDTSSGGITKIANVEATTILPVPQGLPSTTPQSRVLRALADAQGTTRNLYLFTPGAGAPTKLNPAPLPAGLTIDTASADAHAYVLAPDGTGGTSVSAFDVTGAPNFRTILPSLLWPTTSLKSTLMSRGRKTTGTTYLALAHNASATDLVAIDPVAAKVTSLQAGVTRYGGVMITSSDDLVNSAQILRPLTSGRYAFNTAASFTQLTPGVLDANGAHVLTGTFDNAAWNTLTVSTDASTAAFITGSSVAIAKLPASGAVTPVLVAAATTPSLVAVSANGATIGYAAGNTVTTMTADGQSAAAPLTTTASSFSKLWVDAQAVVAVDAVGQAMAGKVGVAASGINVTASAYSATCLAFADGNRVLVNSGAGTLVEVDPTQTPVAIANTYSVSSSSVVMNAARTRAFFLGNGLTALRSDGSKDTQTGAWSSVPMTSPSGKTMYFRDSTGRVIAYGETGAPLEIATSLASTSTDYLRPLNNGADYALLDYVDTHYDLVVAHADTGARTVVVSKLVATSPGFDSGPSSSLRPWTNADGTAVFGLGDTNPPSTAALPQTPKVRLAAFTSSPVVIGDNVATSPAPALDSSRASILFQTNKESQFGTSTYMSYAIGQASAIVVAENVRTYATSPDGKAVAAVVVKDGQLVLQSGAAGQPTVAMGTVGYASLSSSNLVFSDDGQRLFTFDVASSGGTATTGMLLTGAVGAQGLTSITTHALGVFPDKTGKQAAILTRDVDASGRILSRFVAR